MTKYIIILIVIIFFTLFGLIKKIQLKNRSKNINKQYFKDKWIEIEKAADMKSEMGYKMAIIEADKLLDNAFIKLGTAGSTMGERLKVIVYKYPNLKKVWEAHIIRNKISHESNFKLYDNTAKRALSIYKDALKEIGIL
jgi:hypothetical protein